MKIDLYTATGTKKGSLELPAGLFEAPINKGLMHLAVVRQQSNRRNPIAHVKTRGDVVGTTKKAYAQKHTGNARRGALRSPLVRGGGKTFGPRSNANFQKDMPKKMRRAALFSCLSLRAKEGAIIGLENYPDDIKTKTFYSLLQKLPVDIGRRIVVVTAKEHLGIQLSARNVPRVKTIYAQYLNPEDILLAKNIIFMADAVKAAEEIFGKKDDERVEKRVTKQADKVTKKAKELKDYRDAKFAAKTAAKKEGAEAPKKAKKPAAKKAAKAPKAA